MAENYPQRSVSLSRLLGRITELFEEQISPHEVWVKAEVSSFKRHSSGHLYFDLVEQKDSRQIARCRANVWRAQVDHVLLRSKIDLSKHLEDGREILCLARATFHPVFGLSLNISDVDPDFALGEVEKRRRESIKRLDKEGLLKINRSLSISKVVQRIAVIAAPGSAGLSDLIQQIEKNNYGYSFRYTHFEASVQGSSSISSLIKAFDAIDSSLFDAIVLIRGGGASLDLDVFNNYELNAHLSRSTLPFIVGIGHETDKTVVDEWAAISLKTPSAVGAWLVERCRDFDIEVSNHYQSIMEWYRSEIERQGAKMNDRLQVLASRTLQLNDQFKRILDHQTSSISAISQRRIQTHREKIRLVIESLSSTGKQGLTEARFALSESVNRIDRYGKETLVKSKYALETNAELIEIYKPGNTLKRGYSILKKEGMIVIDSNTFKPGDQLEVETFSVDIQATINQIVKKNDKQKG